MSTRRLSNIDSIPHSVTRAFRNASEPKTSQEVLWREVAARMTLDALGYTGLTGERDKHDNAVREARRWFKGIPYPESPKIVFDYADMTPYFPSVKTAVLNHPVTYFRDIEDEELEDEFYVDERQPIEDLDIGFSGPLGSDA